MRSYIRLALSSALALSFASSVALAAPVKRAAPLSNDLMGGTYSYQVQPGDTVRALVDYYFANSGDKVGAAAVVKLNHLSGNGDHLTPGSTLQIPRRYLNRVPARAVVAAYRGTVTLGNGRPTKVNSVVSEGARIETGPDSSVSFLLEDGSLITLPSQSVFTLEKLRLVLMSGELEHIFRLDKGRSQFTVSPAKGPESKFQVKTPVSVSAVRGTEFRIEVEDEGKSAVAAVLKDNVDVSSASGVGNNVMVDEGFGNKSTPAGVGKPVKLLDFPEVVLPIYRNSDGTLTVNIKAIDGAARYRLQVASDLAFQDVREEVVTDKTFFGLTRTPTGSYFVKVTAIDSNGIEGMQHIYPFEYHR